MPPPGAPTDAARAASLAPVLLLVCDVEGRALWANDRWHEVTGWRPGPDAPDWTAAVHPQDRPGAERVVRPGAAESRDGAAEVRLRAADGSYRWILLRAHPWCAADGSPAGTVAAGTDITERRAAEEGLRRSEELFSRAFQASPAAISISTLDDGKYLYVNERFLQFIGRARQDVIGRTALDLAFWGDPTDRERIVAELRRGGSLRDVPVAIQRHDGERRQALVSLELVELGGQACLLGLSYDVSERHRAEEAVRKSEERFRALVENSSEAVVLVDARGAVVYQSPSAFRILGYTAGERVGRPAFELVHPDDLPSARMTLQACLTSTTPQPLQARVRRKDGSWRDLDMVATNHLEDAAVGAIIVNYRDVTDRKRAEDDLRRSQEWLERAQAVAHVGSWVSDPGQGGRLEWSAETLRIFGLGAADFDGSLETFFAMVHPEDRAAVREASEAALGGEGRYSVDHRILRADGTVRWVHEEADVLRDAEGRPASMIGTVQDITDRRRLEEQLLQSQKMEAVGRLAGGIAHDFNNLLTAIIGYSDLLARRVKGTPRLEHNVGEILEAAERAAGLTRQLLAFSRKQVLQPRVLSLNAAVTDIESMLRRVIGEDIQLVTALAGGLGQVRADPTQLEQVILNLAVNARDAMPRGGRLVLETANVDLDDDDARYVMLAVSDNGVGMDAETQSRVFEPFFTTKEPGKGTGLGLAMVYGIVAQSGGSIRVDSEPGRGTTFKVLLPRVDEPPAVDPPRAERPAGGGFETVLVAEDEDGVRALICEVLRSLGYRVLEAPRPEAALDLMAGEGAPVRLLLTDVVMPGMDGRQLAERLTARQPGLRVLYMSGYTGEAIARHGVLEHGTQLLQKPFTPEALARKVREVLDAR